MYQSASQETVNIERIMRAFDNACQDIWAILLESLTRFEQYKQLTLPIDEA